MKNQEKIFLLRKAIFSTNLASMPIVILLYLDNRLNYLGVLSQYAECDQIFLQQKTKSYFVH